MSKRKPLTIAIIIFLFLTLPLMIYLALTKQLIFKRAAFGQVTINLVPTQVAKNVGEEFPVEIYLNSGDLPVSAVTIALNFESTPPAGGVGLRDKNQYEVGEGKPFTEVISSGFPSSFTLLAKNPTKNFPKEISK